MQTPSQSLRLALSALTADRDPCSFTSRKSLRKSTVRLVGGPGWRLLLAVIVLVLVGLPRVNNAAGPQRPGAAFDPRVLDLQNGDVVFQHLTGKLGAVITDVTDSPFNHCGMIVYKKGEPCVIEAIGPVRYVPLKKWLQQGDLGNFAQYRLKSITEKQIAKTVQAAEEFLDLPYDLQYELDDDKIYCSELIYKAYSRGARIEVGAKTPLRELQWKRHEQFIRTLAGGELPLDRKLVTPASIASDTQFRLMYTTFPARRSEPQYQRQVLAGRWVGDYTIKSLEPATAHLEFDREGKFVSGEIVPRQGAKVAIRSVETPAFQGRREFPARIRDARNLQAEAQVQIRDEGRTLIGCWVDSQGNEGVFSLARQPD
ncbi:MAG: hypothetical protein JSS02_05325 [Planctomycetes bacterium]|nr:hypothetical protein [Planctomycetota bacterium]